MKSVLNRAMKVAKSAAFRLCELWAACCEYMDRMNEAEEREIEENRKWMSGREEDEP